MTKRAKVVVISGMPCTGKTSIGKVIARKVGLPFFCRDSFKEILFDDLGWDSKEFSQKLGRTTFHLLFDVARELIDNNCSFICETNFFRGQSDEIFKEIGLGKCDFLEVHCSTEKRVLLERFREREKSDERHPGHKYRENEGHLAGCFLTGIHDPLQIGDLIMVNTTDFEKVDIDDIVQKVNEFITC